MNDTQVLTRYELGLTICSVIGISVLASSTAVVGNARISVRPARLQSARRRDQCACGRFAEVLVANAFSAAMRFASSAAAVAAFPGILLMIASAYTEIPMTLRSAGM